MLSGRFHDSFCAKGSLTTGTNVRHSLSGVNALSVQRYRDGDANTSPQVMQPVWRSCDLGGYVELPSKQRMTHFLVPM